MIMNVKLSEKFPSPIYGASFKPCEKFKKSSEIYSKFPSPIYGASFKRSITDGEVIRFYQFPSPIYGASFKLKNIFYVLVSIIGFRPLYTGLVSN